MGYSDQKYQSRPLFPVALNTNVGTATATASGQVTTNSGVAVLPQYTRRTQINNVNVIVNTAPAAGAATTQIAFMNGTNTFAVATIGTLTAGQVATAAMTAANAIFAATAQPTVNAIATATASANSALGAYSFFFEQQELPA